jgi:hypothetical protein
MHMATLQVKRVPDELYAKAKARAQSEGISLTELVLRMLERELAMPTMREWLDRVNSRRTEPIEVDIEKLMDEVRGEFE